jgi:hypothetical protein
MLDAYYRGHEWDVASGLQSKETLSVLNLEEVAEKLGKYGRLI